MLTSIHPKLPMSNKQITKEFYLSKLGFNQFGNDFSDAYLMVEKDNVQIHFFEFNNLVPTDNYGQVYIRTKNIEIVYNSFIKNNVEIHPNGNLEIKPWGQKEFSLLDPDHNLLTFGETI